MNEQYLSSFGEILLFIITGILFPLLVLLISKFIRPHKPNAEKLATYESGEEPITTAWTQFNIRFYIVALIFLLFEVEIVFLFPWSTIFADESLIHETNGRWGWLTLIEATVFVAILALGLAYAWVNGHLDWIKPEPKPTEIKSVVPKKMYDAINATYSNKKTGS
jgi:NADH-quinone oxidoreductase subunit A